MFVTDPGSYLADLKARGERWTPMNAARLVMGPVADSIREDMGAHWLNVAIAAHLSAYPEHRSFAHATLQAWLDYQSDRIGEDEYHRRLAECADDGKREFMRNLVN